MQSGAIIGVMKIGGRRHRRVWLAVGWIGGAAVTVSVLYAVVQLSRGGLQPQDTAGLLGLPLGAAALLVSVLALRKPPEGNAADLVRTWAATGEGLPRGRSSPSTSASGVQGRQTGHSARDQSAVITPSRPAARRAGARLA